MNTGERLMRVETQIEGIETKIDAQTERSREDFQIVFKKIDGLGDKFRSRFAGKWVEKIVLGIIVALAVGITGLILTGSFT